MENKLIILEESLMPAFLEQLYIINKNLNIFLLENAKDTPKDVFQNKYQVFESDLNLKSEIYNFQLHIYLDKSQYPCLAFEFINGHIIIEDIVKQLQLTEKVSIIVQLMMAIKFLHEKKLIFRDLKLKNIMIDQN